MGRGQHMSRKTLVWIAVVAGLLGGCDKANEAAGQISEATTKACGDGYNAETGAVSADIGVGLEASVGLKVKSFLETSTKIRAAGIEIENEAITACKVMATELMIPAAALTVPEADKMKAGVEVKLVCGAVAAEIEKVIHENLPVEASLVIKWTPPKCSASVDAQLKCTQACETMTVMEKDIVCKPGKLSYECGAKCEGSCSGSCMAECSGGCTGDCMGECDAEISGTCMGTCDGQCEGTCMGDTAGGKCKGSCMGKCSGKCTGKVMAKCSGSCKGSCMGSCSGSCSGSCMGSCSASCAGTVKPPTCEEVEVTRMKTTCDTNCDARAKAEAKCEAPALVVDFGTNLGDPVRKAKIEGLISALKKGLPAFIKAGFRAKEVVQSSAEGYLTALVAVAGEAKGSLKATACLGVATGGAGQAGGRIGGVAGAQTDLLAKLRAKGQAAVSKLTCGSFDPSVSGMVGPTFTGAAGLKLNAMLKTTASLTKAAGEIDTDLLLACKSMGTALGVPAAMLVGDMTTVCTAVKAKITAEITALAMVKVRVVAQPAVCTVAVEARFKCDTACQEKTVTVQELKCEPGELSGKCDVSCTGSCSGMCSAMVSASCSAECEGSCSGEVSATCTGACMGTCEGTCATMGTNGQCAGQCTGKCTGMCMGTIKGSCSAKCEGKCSGSIEGKCGGTCSGSCKGGCSAAVTFPHCERMDVMKQVSECETTCDAQAKCEAMCTAPKIDVVVEGAADVKAKAAAVVKALQDGLPLLIKATTRAKGSVLVSAKGFVTGLKAAPEAIKNAGVEAAGCVAAAVVYAGQAVAKVEASIEVSASLTLAIKPLVPVLPIP